ADGQGRRLAARGAPEGPRRLDRYLPPLRRGAAVVRGVRVGAPGRVPRVRRRGDPPLPGVRGAVLVDLRGRLRAGRRGATRAGALRRADPALRARQVTRCYLSGSAARVRAASSTSPRRTGSP